MFFGNLKKRFLKIIWLDCEQYGKNLYKKKEHNQNSSVFLLLSYLNVKDRLIIPFIFTFLFCREKAHDRKEFSCESIS